MLHVPKFSVYIECDRFDPELPPSTTIVFSYNVAVCELHAGGGELVFSS